MRLSMFFGVFVLIAVAPAGFGGTVSSCANWSTSPITVPPPPDVGDLYTQFTCSLYNDASSYTIPLAALETQGGADPLLNEVSAAYFVVINGDPNTLADNGTGLYNQALWQTVLYFPVDSSVCATCSDSLTVYWPGAFPLAATVQSFDRNLWGYVAPDPTFDPFFFLQSTGSETVWAPDANHEYDIYNTPEPGTIVLLGSSLALLGGLVLRRRRTAGRAV